MTQDMHMVHARVGKPLPLSELAAIDPTLSEIEIKVLLEAQIREHYGLFGSEPFKLEYSRELNGYAIRPNAVVGLINCERFCLQIGSKFPDVEIGKWLQLAHYAGATDLVNHNNDVAESAVSDQDHLAGLDYFVLSLVSATYDCVNQGLLTESSTWSGIDPNLRGKLHVANHVKDGGNPYRVHTTQQIKDAECKPNAVIRTALDLCVSQCTNEKLRGLCTGLLPYFSEVEPLVLDNAHIDCEYVSSIPRPDYERALSLSKIIIDGFSSVEGDIESFVPYYTIDLDKLFEAFVSFAIKRMLREDLYRVTFQYSRPHPISPELAGNFISPDILVESKDEDAQKAVILDTKNKYSLVSKTGAPKIANADLFQMVYYCLALDTDIAVLVYPGNAENCTKYPIPGSEGRPQYEKKRNRALQRMFDERNCAFRFEVPSLKSGITIVAWRINLSGTLRNTRDSIAQLCQFIADCSGGQILDD